MVDTEVLSDLLKADPFGLPYVLMSEMNYLPRHGGVYLAIREEKEIVYIGQTADMQQRWTGHHIRPLLCDFSSIESARSMRLAWISIQDADMRIAVEAALIAKFQPALNNLPANERAKLAVYPKASPATISENVRPERTPICKGTHTRRVREVAEKMAQIQYDRERAVYSWIGCDGERKELPGVSVRDILRQEGYLVAAARLVDQQYVIVPCPAVGRYRRGY